MLFEKSTFEFKLVRLLTENILYVQLPAVLEER